MDKLRKILSDRRKKTEDTIRELENEGRTGVRYTIMLSDFSLLSCTTASAVGVLIYFISEIYFFYFYGYTFNNILKVLMAAEYVISIMLIIGVIASAYLRKINQMDIATKRQKNLSLGLIALSGILAYIVAIVMIVVISRMGEHVAASLILMGVGGLVVFAFSLPIYVSFKKGIYYRNKA